MNIQQEKRLRKDIADGWKDWVLCEMHTISHDEVRQWRRKIRAERREEAMRLEYEKAHPPITNFQGIRL